MDRSRPVKWARSVPIETSDLMEWLDHHAFPVIEMEVYDTKPSFLHMLHLVYTQHVRTSASVISEDMVTDYLYRLRTYLYSQPTLTGAYGTCADFFYTLCNDAPLEVLTMDYYHRHVKHRISEWITTNGHLEEHQIRDCFPPSVRSFYRHTINSLILLLIPWFQWINTETSGTSSTESRQWKNQLILYMMDRIMTTLMDMDS